MVSIEVFGQKQYTSVHKRTLSCVFDEVFLFNQRAMDKEDFEAAVGLLSLLLNWPFRVLSGPGCTQA